MSDRQFRRTHSRWALIALVCGGGQLLTVSAASAQTVLERDLAFVSDQETDVSVWGTAIAAGEELVLAVTNVFSSPFRIGFALAAQVSSDHYPIGLLCTYEEVARQRRSNFRYEPGTL